MFKKSIKSLIEILLFGAVLSILFLSLSSGAIIGESESPFEPIIRPNAPILDIYRIYEINDDDIGASEGDDDNIVDAGETIELRLEIENTGDQGVTNVAGNISSLNLFVDIQTSLQTYLDIAAGATGISISYYVVEFDCNFNASDIVSFDLEITTNEGTWYDTFDLTIVGVPDPVFMGHTVYSESNGDLIADNDDIIDPGEDISLHLYVENNGDANFDSVAAYITTNDPYVTVDDGSGYYGIIDGNGGYEYATFGIIISGGCPLLHTIQFNLSHMDSSFKFWNSTFELVVSGFPEYDLVEISLQEHYGDDDSFVDAGETWYATMTIKNIGDALGTDVFVYLNSNDSDVDFYYSDTSRSFGDLYTGFSDTQTGTYDWQFTLSDRVTEGEELAFFVTVVDSSGQPDQIINTTVTVVGVADYNLTAINFVEDDYYDDANGIVEAGDTWSANMTIKNIGAATGYEIIVYLYSTDEYVELYYDDDPSYDFGTMLEGDSKTINSFYSWEFTISDKAKTGQILNFTVVIVDASLREWHFAVSLVVEDGPNTWWGTPEGLAIIIGGPLAFVVFCIAPYFYKQVKAKGGGLGWSESFNIWRDERKNERTRNRKEREKLRKQKREAREARRQEEERERIAQITDNEKKLLEKFESILKMSESVEISFVAKSLAISESQLFEKLIQWQDVLPFKIDGEYIEVKDTDVFSESVREKIAEMSKFYSCNNCGFPIEIHSDICPDCKSNIPKCVVCKLPISLGDAVGSCKHCEAKAHLDHLQEWQKTQGKCPVCMHKLTAREIVQKVTQKKKK
ncbi:MAG: hypothetical protein ACTSP7_06895 [Candidatus Heimdallarchaeota archaeon]